LTKPGIAVFVMITAGVGYYVASRGAVVAADLVNTMLGTLVATGGALTLNQYLERGPDAIMLRTRSRPLPSGRVRPGQALVFGSLLNLVGTTYLALTVGWLPTAITAASTLAYTLVYTPLKSRSYLATPIGAIPGAVPALIGWSAATGSLSSGALVLFAIGFLWQLPHVLSLGWMLRDDYARVGFRLIPPSDPEGRRLGRHLVFYSLALIPMSLAPTFLGLTGELYLVGAAILGVGFLSLGLPCLRNIDDTRARRVFLGTLLYHPLLLGMMVLGVGI
jgi:protoheme IX farnesyltransferase